MKVLIDAMPASYGGIAVYTENLIAGWVRRFPQDEVTVLLPAGAHWWPLADGAVRYDIRFPAVAWVLRSAVLTVRMPRIVERLGIDAVVAANPATVVRRCAVPLAVVTHDLRHELRPEQFPLHRRVLRTLSHRHGVRTANLAVAVSERTAADLRSACPDLPADRIVVVHEGADHVDRWDRGHGHGMAVAFGHHTNKNLDLILQAWASAADLPDLMILGLRATAHETVAAAVDSAGIQDRVRLAPYLEAAEFQRVMTGARLVLFPSDFEGFGLPVVEAMRLRIPVVIGPEKACLEVAGGHASVLPEWTPAGVVTAARSALATDRRMLETAGRHADGFTWARTAEGIRDALRERGVHG